MKGLERLKALSTKNTAKNNTIKTTPSTTGTKSVVRGLARLEELKKLNDTTKTAEFNPTGIKKRGLARLDALKTASKAKEPYYSPNFQKWEDDENRAFGRTMGALYSTPKRQSDVMEMIGREASATGIKSLENTLDIATVSGINSYNTNFNNWRSTIRTDADFDKEKKQITSQIETLENEKNKLGEPETAIEAYKKYPSGNPDELKKYESQAEQKKTLENQIQELKNKSDLLDEEKDWNKYFSYYNLISNSDFKEKSTYKKKDVSYRIVNGSYNGTPITTSVITNGTENQHIYNLVNGDKDAYEHITVNDTAVFNTLDDDKNLYFTDDEKAIFNYLWATKGENAAIEYANYLSDNLQMRRNEQQRVKDEEYAKSHPVKSTFGEIIKSPLTNMATGIGTIADYVDDGTIDENDALYTHKNRKDTTYGAVREQIDSPVGQFLYNAGINIGEQGMAMLIGGGNKYITLGTQVAGGFGSTVIDAKKKGLSDDEAFGLGIVNAAAEIFFESKSFDALFDGDTLKQSGWKYLKNNLKTELIGELGTEAANDIADGIISGDLSDFQLSIDRYVAEGMDRTEATKATLFDYAKKYVVDVGGVTLLSAGLMSGVPVAVKSVSNAIINANFNNVNYKFGVTQKNINDYVDAAFENQNTQEYKKYAIPSERLISDVSDEISLEGYSHALRDNDIRHIKNSHGENTSEKYPIAADDIKLIPWLVENYDKVIVVNRKDGKTGLVYVKKMEDNLVYYLEQVTQKYGNESLLVNKQMIKTGMFDIPDLPELPESIAKKQSVVEFLNDLNKIPQVYVQDVYQPHSNKTITQPDASVKSDNADYYIQTDESSSQLPYTVQNDPLPFVTAEEYVTEEYREKTASNRAFTDDPTKYEGKERYIVERAIASGVLNDTEASHRLVDLAAKLYARTGVEFEFVDNARLKESGFSVGNRFVNGVYTGKTVLINAESRKAWQSVIGHEITHVLEGSQHYDSLQKAVIGYAKQIGTYEAKLQEITDTYSAVENADINGELTAELVGEYLFSDEGFVNSLAAKHPNVAQRILSEIKHVISLIKANTPEARKLLTAQHRLERALNSKLKNNSGEVRYSLTQKDVRDLDINWDPDNFSTLKEQLIAHLDEVNSMQPVVDVTYSKQDKRPYYKVLEDTLKKSFGNKIDVQGLGSILFDEDAISSIENYAKTDPERAAAIASPYVIKKGKIISGHKNHKGQGTVSITFAAPAILNGEKGNIVVSVMFGKGRVHSLRVLSPKGKAFELLKTKDTESRTEKISFSMGRSNNATVDPYINSMSENMITSPDGNVNNNFSLSEQSYTSADNQGTPLIDLYYNGDGEADTAETDSDVSVADSFFDSPEMNLSGLMELGQKERVATEPQRRISADPKRNKQGLRSRIADTGDLLYRKLVDSGKAISDIAKTVKDKYLYAYYNEARSSHNIATHMMSKVATDVNGNATGKSLKDIFAPIKSRGKQYYTDFQDYLFHKHNISRMSYRNERAIQEAAEAVRDFRIRHPEISMLDDATLRNMAYNPNDVLSDIAAEYVELLNNRDTLSGRQNKSVFGADENGELITAERSEQAVQDLLDEHPEFEALAQEVYGYIDNLMKYRVDSGLITQEDADYLKSVYPHYVPTYRVTEHTGSRRQLNRADTSTAIGRATGGTSTLMELEQALSKLTEKVVREGTKNRFGMRLFRYANMPETKRYITSIAEAGADFNPSSYIDEEAGIEELNTANVFSVYNKGKKWELEVNDSLFEAVSALTPKPNSSNLGLRGLAAANNVYKRLITGYNPAFWIRNGVKDIQDAGINSKDLSEFAKAYPTAISEIANNGEYWKRYQALGGLHNSNYDYSTGMIDENTGLIKKGLDKVEAVSSFIEQLPRLAEFIATVNKNGGLENASTDVLAEAMYNAAEITTNFGRSGQWSKALNTYAVPFWNPSIQGFDKIIRNLSETKGYKDWFRLITKTAILGLAPFALNALLYSDDEDWEAVREEDKANYFLFKYDDGKWIKIPRGRFYSALGYTADEVADAFGGEGFDVKGVASHIVNQIGPANPLTNNFFMPLVQAKLFDDENPGETWYGSDIESQSLQSLPVAERYDARTDEVSKWLGRTLRLSPKKINYLLNQYGGVLADVVLPMMTPAAENNIFSANFTLNTLPSNAYTDRYYEAKKDAEYSANGTDATPTYELMSRYWSKQDTLLKEINREIRRIEADGSVSDKEKKEMLEAQYALRNELYKKALDGQDTFRREGEGFYGEADSISDDADRLDFAYTMAAEAVNPELTSKGSAKTTYDKLAGAGLSDSVCTSLTRAIVSLEPLGDKTSVSQAQKWDAVAQAGYPEETTLEALKALVTEEAQSKKLDLCYDNNVPLKAFTALKLNMSEYDTNGNGSYSAAEYQKAIDGLFPTDYGFVLPGGDNEISLTVQQKAALWQIATGSSSVKNNPSGDYASGIAQAFNDGKASESGTQPKYNLPERKFNLPKREYNFPTRQ